MAKSAQKILLLPGASGWETWSASTGDSATLISHHEVSHPSEVLQFPVGELLHLFPVRAFTALPLQVPTGDSTLFPDLAETHAERVGLRPDPMAGQLTDIFPISVTEEKSAFLSVVLRSPSPTELPVKAAKSFDISPRAYPVTGNAIVLWQELGHWVFSLYQDGKLLYCQSTSGSSKSLDSPLIREIRIALTQLSMQGFTASPERIIVYTDDAELNTELLAKAFSVETSVSPRPAPIVPEPISALLPADVRAARREAKRKRNTNLAIAIVALLYLSAVGVLGYNLWQVSETTKALNERITAIAPEGEAYAQHIAKWDELEPALDANLNTVDILSRIAKSIPPSSGLRLITAEISPTEIRLVGEAPQPQAVNQFSLNLSKNNDLALFTWQTPEPQQSNLGWKFNFAATSTTTP